MLAAQEAFTKSNQEPFFSQILKEDQFMLQSLVTEVGEMRDTQLDRSIYREYSYTASHSNGASSVQPYSEYTQVRYAWSTDTFPCLFTLGYEGLSIDAYVNILLANNITALIDVRKNPLSMKYGFSKTKLREYLRQVNITYFHLADLDLIRKPMIQYD